MEEGEYQLTDQIYRDLSPQGPAGPSAFWKLSDEINPQFQGDILETADFDEDHDMESEMEE